MASAGKLFPCPLCAHGLEIRETKKRKPYVVCDPCGVQLFVRNDTGIGRFKTLVRGLETKNVWERLEKLQRQYEKKCPTCGRTFWIEPERVKTSWLDGRFVGYRCPGSNCNGVVEVKEPS